MYIITDNNNRFFDKHGHIVTGINNAFKWKRELKARNVLEHCSNANGFEIVDTLELETCSEDFDTSIDDLISSIKSVYKNYVTDSRVNYLEQKISKLDLEIVDIQHAIEFNIVNVVGGYKYYKLMHDVLNERREAKDELQKIMLLKSMFSPSQAKNLVSSIEGINDKRYTPRVLRDLFEEEK